MKEQIQKYIEDKCLFEKVDINNIKKDIKTIVDSFTNIPSDSNDSSIVLCRSENRTLHLYVYFKRKYSNYEKFRLLECIAKESDINFKES